MMTSQETTPVTSNVFVISNPVITPLPGVATVYNTAGVLMTQSNSLATAIGYVNTNTLAGATINKTNIILLNKERIDKSRALTRMSAKRYPIATRKSALTT